MLSTIILLFTRDTKQLLWGILFINGRTGRLIKRMGSEFRQPGFKSGCGTELNSITLFFRTIHLKSAGRVRVPLYCIATFNIV